MKIILLIILIICCWTVCCYYEYDREYFARKMEEVKQHEKVIKEAPTYIHAILKKVVIYPRTNFMVQKTYNTNFLPQTSIPYNGSIAGFSDAIHQVMHNVDVFAEGIRDLSGIILKELEQHFDDYGVPYFDGVIIAQRHANVIGIGKSDNATIDWLQYSGRCIYIKYYEVKHDVSQRIETCKVINTNGYELFYLIVIMVIISFVLALCCAACGVEM